MSTIEQRADANIAALWEIVAARIGGVYIADPAFPISATGLPAAPLNGAIVLAPLVDPEAALARVEKFMADRGLPYVVWVRDGVDDRTVDVATERGYQRGGRPPAMVLDLIIPIPTAPSHVRVERVNDELAARHFRHIFQHGFPVPAAAVDRLLTLNALTGGDLGSVVLYVDDEPASCALVGVSNGIAGIYNVATVPEFRRRGLGALATWEANRIGVERGCTHSVLQASEMGQPVYAAMGYETIGEYVQLLGPPSTT